MAVRYDLEVRSRTVKGRSLNSFGRGERNTKERRRVGKINRKRGRGYGGRRKREATKT